MIPKPKASSIDGIRARRRWQGIVLTSKLRATHTVEEIAAITGRAVSTIRLFLTSLDRLEGSK